MFELRTVLVRLRQGDADRDIARAGLMGRRKCAQLRALAGAQGWLDTAKPLPDDATLATLLGRRPPPTAPSLVEPFRDQVAAWVERGIQATTIHQALVREKGFCGSYSSVRRFVQALQSSTPVATVILDFAPGEAAQVDFGSGPLLPDPVTGALARTWVFVMTLCASRHQYAEIVRDQRVETWLLCHRHAFEWFGGVPQRLIIDNPKCAITRACARDPQVQRAYGECAEGYGFKIDPCPPRDPQKKGRVEAGVKYIKRSFLPLRTFTDLADANAQLRSWVLEHAGNRLHGRTRTQPLRQFQEVEKPLLGHLPDVPPQLTTWAQVTVHRDAHVQFEKCLYSVPFRLIGQRLWLQATPSTVALYRDHELLATHPRLRYAGQRSTVDDHLPPEALAHKLRDPQWCQAQGQRIGTACAQVIAQLFADRVLENLRAAQGVIALEKRFGAPRVEAACARALSFGEARYRAIKTILEKGLDSQVPTQAANEPLTEAYTGAGRFCRDTRTLLLH